jgi:hypothetical protein
MDVPLNGGESHFRVSPLEVACLRFKAVIWIFKHLKRFSSRKLLEIGLRHEFPRS